jgi:hypothetical protein
MPNYPPKLLRVSEADCGSVLHLEDDGQVAVDVRPARLNEAFLQDGLPPLEDLIAAGKLGVFVGMPHMNSEQWDRIRECVRSSAVAAEVFRKFPLLWANFRESYDVIVELPHRVYGGLSEWSLYTSLPINFATDPNRPIPWYRALLSAPGGWLFNTWVHLQTGEIEILSDQHPGHFVE